MAAENPTSEWEEWGDEHDALSAETTIYEPSLPLASSLTPDTPNKPSLASPPSVEQPTSRRELLAWAWDLDDIDAELAALAPSRDWIPTAADASVSDGSQHQTLHALASLAGPTRARLGELGERTRAMRAQTAVARWRLQHLAHGLRGKSESDDLSAIERTLEDLAGDWGRLASNDETYETTQLDEMSRLLQHALDTCEDGDVVPFQQALEQLFASLPDQRLVVPTAWIRPPTDSPQATDAEKPSSFSDAFVARLVELCGDENTQNRVCALAEAQVFQDTKDIQRDEVVVNGEHVVGGAVGYDAVVTTIENHLRDAITQTSLSANNVQTTLRHAAQQVLSACNRTESGGCSYEILSQFVTQHQTHCVLIRPASARAPPLMVTTDVGAFVTRNGDWCFGLRVGVSAVTWYCICDADDPTHELFEVETTYANRLAFPLGLTPLVPRDLLRQDAGQVTIRLRIDETAECPQQDEDDVDYDGLI